MKKLILLFIFLVFNICGLKAKVDSFKVLVLTERGGQHGSFTDAALIWLKATSLKERFELVEVNKTDLINVQYLSGFRLIIQLDYPPYGWTKEAEQAFKDYIENGRGGWVGFHHATLLGEFDGFPLWRWFSNFMGGIRFKNYIAKKASATVYVEDRKHPVMKGVHDSFLIPNDEWYTFDKNPRAGVHVIANVDEDSYQPVSDIKMGDHPVIWSNTKVKARNVYFLFGHSDSLFASEDFKTMFANAIKWAAER